MFFLFFALTNEFGNEESDVGRVLHGVESADHGGEVCVFGEACVDVFPGRAEVP